MISAELQALVSAGVIDQGQAEAAMAAAPAPNEFMGLARCLNHACEMADTDRPIRLRKTYIRIKAPDLPIDINVTSHNELVDEGDVVCPECGENCAILPKAPPKYQQLIR